MSTVSLPATVALPKRHQLHPVLVPIPIVFFIGTFLTDIAYWMTDDIMWDRFSIWLVTIGFITAVIAAVAGLIDLLISPLTRQMRSAWLHSLGNIVLLGLGLLNVLVHTRDAYTSVLPWGLTLSTIIVLLLVVTGWLGRDIASRQRIEVRHHLEVLQ